MHISFERITSKQLNFLSYNITPCTVDLIDYTYKTYMENLHMQYICIKAIVHHLHHFSHVATQIGEGKYLQETLNK